MKSKKSGILDRQMDLFGSVTNVGMKYQPTITREKILDTFNRRYFYMNVIHLSIPKNMDEDVDVKLALEEVNNIKAKEKGMIIIKRY